MPIYLKEQDVIDLADMPSVIASLRTTFLEQARGAAVNVPRMRLEFGNRRLNVMAGGAESPQRHAVKCYGSSAHHVLLYSADAGLLAIMEASALGAIRTGAASAVATEAMTARKPARVGLIGAGRQARTQLHALHAIGRIAEVTVSARSREAQATFCQQLSSELGLPVRPTDSAEEAVRGAGIVVTATTSSRPVLMSGWLAGGVHINAMGANAASRRELDPEIVLRASLVVTDDVEQAKLEAGEFIDLAAAGKFDWSRLTPLERIVGAGAPTIDLNAITLFKSLGIGLEDLAIASLVYDRAAASGRCKPL
jgi:ornithine cyclodeaminase/alanine dehydrogenase-like protein (mu-crystallin family)